MSKPKLPSPVSTSFQPNLMKMAPKNPIENLSDYGMNLEIFKEWYKGKEEESSWPQATLSMFFSDRLKDYCCLEKPIDFSINFFESMGLQTNKAADFAEWWPTASQEMQGTAIDEVLAITFSELIRRSQYRFPRERISGSTLEQLNKGNLTSTRPDSICQLMSARSSDQFSEEIIHIQLGIRRFNEIPPSREMYYHSCSLNSAASIVTTSPFPGSPVGHGRDFNSAFYLNLSKDAAVKWATHISERTNDYAVVLVYQIPDSIRIKWKELKLETGHLWSKVVTAFRREDYSSIDLGSFLKNCHVVSGPICLNPIEVKHCNQEPRSSSQQQLAILSSDIACTLNEYLTGYLIVG